MPADWVFIIGAGRSGTTWLQQLLGAHPQIVAPQEMDLFGRYVAEWREIWRGHLPDDPEIWRQRRHRGLPAVLTQEAFDELLLDAIRRVEGELVRLKPTARVVAVKEAGLSGEMMLDLLPRAGFVHIIRDGRDVTASMVRASRGWGHLWAPNSIEWGAHAWRKGVQTGRATAGLTDRYVEVAYESLRSNAGPEVLRRLFDFCGVESDAAACARIYDRFSLDRPQDREPRSSVVWGGEVARRVGAGNLEPEGFAGTGGVGAWKRELGLRERLLFDSVAGDLLRELGYEGDRSWIGSGRIRRLAARTPLAVSWRVGRLRHGIAARIAPAAPEGRIGSAR